MCQLCDCARVKLSVDIVVPDSANSIDLVEVDVLGCWMVGRCFEGLLLGDIAVAWWAI